MAGIARFCLVSRDAESLASFYADAFGALTVSRQRDSDASTSTLLAIGAQRVELLAFDRPGRPYPADADASGLAFQHFAIVVVDIDAAYRKLQATSGCVAISHAGPQRLPVESGGVTAFKFRDPEGHPLELLQFPAMSPRSRWRAKSPPGNVLGIDHSALSVADTERSIAFYESLGLCVTARSFNEGVEQDRLDGLSGAQVHVTALRAPDDTPHLELLCYRDRGPPTVVEANDVAATRVVFRSNESRDACLVDPDGHRIVVLAGSA
ncbi:MAG: VOC family protein [Rudaea sp.]